MRRCRRHGRVATVGVAKVGVVAKAIPVVIVELSLGLLRTIRRWQLLALEQQLLEAL